MATELFKTTDAPGNNVFFVFWNAAGQVLDHSDQTFKALGSATTPNLNATEVTNQGGVSQSAYTASLDLADVNATPSILAFGVEVYRRAGGSVDLATDLLLSSGEIRVAASEFASGSVGTVPPGYVVKCGMCLTGTDGDHVELVAWVEKDGKPITLDAGDECTFDCFEHTSGVSQFTGPTTAVNPSATNLFETTYTPTTFADNTVFTLQATCTIGGVVMVGQESFPCVG